MVLNIHNVKDSDISSVTVVSDYIIGLGPKVQSQYEETCNLNQGNPDDVKVSGWLSWDGRRKPHVSNQSTPSI